EHDRKDDWDAVGSLILASAGILANAGAEFLICPDNTIHQAIDIVRDRSPLPWLHIAEEVAREAAARRFKRVGLTGTKYLMEGPVYPPHLRAAGIDCVIPDRDERWRIDQIIFDELVNGRMLA